jgi:eukaryotic-like serine/threonine-protein kinase
MTSTAIGLPDRYRPLDEVGPTETTATGVIHCWRAKDRILNRDVAIRVHTPGGPAAREWITRALTAGGLATPALAMVYDAAEGSGDSGDSAAPGGAAYVVNEWIEGRTLAERLAEGPMPEREARTVLRRLAEGVAAAHRVGLAVGGLTPETVVLRPNGLVGLRSVPAASGTVQGDVAALGELLEYCLTGRRPGTAPAGRTPGMPPDLAALVRRARSTEPGAGLSSVAAMAALLAERPRTGHTADPQRAPDESDSGWLRRLRERREEERAAGAGDDAGTHVAVDPAPTRHASGTASPPLDARGLPPVPARRHDDEDDLLPLSADLDDDRDGAVHLRDDRAQERRRRLLVVGLPLAALAVVIALAVYLGNVISPGDVAGDQAPAPGGPSSSAPPADETDAAGDTPALAITGASVYDPQGDGDPDNPDDVPLSFDGDPSTAWSTVTYRGSAAFGNLKDGIGVLYDLGSEQALTGLGVTGTAGVTVEVRVGDQDEGDLDSYEVVADGELGDATDLPFDEPVTTRYVLLWLTGLAPSDGGFSAEVAEVTLTPAD